MSKDEIACCHAMPNILANLRVHNCAFGIYLLCILRGGSFISASRYMVHSVSFFGKFVWKKKMTSV